MSTVIHKTITSDSSDVIIVVYVVICPRLLKIIQMGQYSTAYKSCLGNLYFLTTALMLK